MDLISTDPVLGHEQIEAESVMGFLNNVFQWFRELSNLFLGDTVYKS